MTITDKTGNVRKYQFLIDKTAPQVAEFDEFTNKTFLGIIQNHYLRSQYERIELYR